MAGKRKMIPQNIRKPSKPLKERCMICKVFFQKVTHTHLKTHGFTTERYRRVFGGLRANPKGSTQIPIGREDDEHRLALVGSVAENIATDKVWLACIADEVGERMLTGPLRQRLTALLTTMLAQRARVQGEALAILNMSLGELKQEWRMTQGGRDGAPTDTDQLLRVVDRASKIVKESEDAVMRTMKLALDEQRTAAEFADGAGPTLFTGDSDQLGVPKQLSSGDRETMRGLLSILQKAASADDADRNTITVTPGGGGGEDPQGRGGEGGAPAVPATDPSAALGEGTSMRNRDEQVPTQSSTRDVRSMDASTMTSTSSTDPTATDPVTDPLAFPSSSTPRRHRGRRHRRKRVDSDIAGGPIAGPGLRRAVANADGFSETPSTTNDVSGESQSDPGDDPAESDQSRA